LTQGLKAVNMEYKEGKDFEWVPMRDKNGNIVKDGHGGAVKTRRFFTKAEKKAVNASYRKAITDEEKKRGKSTDELSFEEALTYFKKYGKEIGATKFRWRGDAYSVSGEKLSSGSKKTTAKKPVSESAPKSTSTRPQSRRTEGQIRSSSGGRTRYTPTEFTTDGGPRRGSVKPESESKSPSAMTEAPTLSGNKTSSGGAPINRSKSDSNVKAGYGSLANANNRMESFKVSKQDKTINGVSFDEWKKLTRAERVEKNLPLTNQEFMRAMRLKGADSAPVVLKSSKDTTDDARARATRTNRSRNSPDIPGMAKGGMVKSGNKNYKKSGMFYKSGSPRGYK
jgi:hypothetical protein